MFKMGAGNCLQWMLKIDSINHRSHYSGISVSCMTIFINLENSVPTNQSWEDFGTLVMTDKYMSPVPLNIILESYKNNIKRSEWFHNFVYKFVFIDCDLTVAKHHFIWNAMQRCISWILSMGWLQLKMGEVYAAFGFAQGQFALLHGTS